MTLPPEPGPDPIDQVLARARDLEPEPNAGFVATIMRRVHDSEARRTLWARWRRARAANLVPVSRVDIARLGTTTEDRRLTAGAGVLIMRKIVWSVAGLGAVAIAGYVWFGSPPAGPGTEATVGGAQRYQAAAPAPANAPVADPVQTFLQSDTFDQLMKNADTRQVLQRAATDPAFRAAFAEPALMEALSEPAFAKAMSEAAFRDLLAKASYAKALAEPAFAKALSEPAFVKALSEPAMRQALASAEFQNALASPEARKRRWRTPRSRAPCPNPPCSAPLRNRRW